MDAAGLFYCLKGNVRLNRKELHSCLILLLTAAIWGFAFVAQRVGAESVPSFAFNGIRFLLGAASLLPLIFFLRKRTVLPVFGRGVVPRGLLVGCVLFTAASLQQIGIEHTSAGKAGFITGFYIILVPIFGIFLGKKANAATFLNACLALAGLFLISVRVQGDFSVSPSDLLEFAGAFFWAVQILMIDRFAGEVNALGLAFFQFITCSGLSLLASALFEHPTGTGIMQAAVPILYGGILSSGVAYTLQIVGQRYARPAHSAIIMSMEAVFAALGGFLLLHENLGLRGYFGCALMIAAILLSQLSAFREASKNAALDEAAARKKEKPSAK